MIKVRLNQFSYVFLAILVSGVYLLASRSVSGWGFPLDDAWIHQTYARNLILYHQWVYFPGQLSGGSTAPLWSLLLSAGYLVNFPVYLWTFGLGLSALIGLAWTGQKWFYAITSFQPVVPWAGLFLVCEYHLLWSAFSGMETILFGLVILVTFYLLSRNASNWLVGSLIGVSIWLRPDGITLLGPALLLCFLNPPSLKSKLMQLISILAPVSVALAGYVAFNLATAGNWLPNTFFAKQAEYSIYLQIPLPTRLFDLATLPMIGAGLLLLPGLVWVLAAAWKKRNWIVISAGLWWLGFTLIYAIRLPVTYQYGRYLVPAMPVYFVLGLSGTGLMIRKFTQDFNRPGIYPRESLAGRFGIRWAWLLIQSWKGLIASCLLIFAAIGAIRYSSDVGIINTEMVATAAWINANTPLEAKIAAHDIGALGYFGSRRIVDLAGLISPEVIPILRDEKALAQFLDQSGAAYLVTFPGWYPQLITDRHLIFQTTGSFSPAAGGENMAVYAWP